MIYTSTMIFIYIKLILIVVQFVIGNNVCIFEGVDS